MVLLFGGFGRCCILPPQVGEGDRALARWRGRGPRRDASIMSLILRRERSEPRRTRPRRLGPHPSRAACGGRLRMRGHKQSFPFPRCIRIRVVPSRCKKARPKTSLQKNGGRRSAERRHSTGRTGADKFTQSAQTICRAARATLSECCHSPRASGALAFRRSTAALASGPKATGSTPGHASWDADPSGVTRLHLSQSRDCTSRAGRSTGVNDARSRPGAGRNPARRDRPRSTFESTLAKGPSVNEMGRDVIGSGTDVKRIVSQTETAALN